MAKKVEESKTLNVEDIKEELNDYIDTIIKKEIDKNYKKLIRVKNKSIIFKNILIIIMALIIVYLLYLLKEADYFDKYFLNNNVESSIVVDRSKVDIKEDKENLISKYSYLLDNIIISENSDYLDDYYNGILSLELKKSIALNLIDLQKYESDDYIVIDSEIIKDQYEKIFESDFEDLDFKFNGNTIKYIKKLNTYISDKFEQSNNSNIKREIINIEEKNSKVYIMTLEAIVKDNRVFNIITKEKLGHYNKSLNEYKDKINTVIYEFNNNKLTKIEVQ